MTNNKYNQTFDIEDQEQEYVLLQPGEYQFEVTDIEYGDYIGSAKIPPCGKVTVKMTVKTDKGTAFLRNNFFVCRECAGLNAAFFKSVGLLKEGQKKLTTDWDATVGEKGWCKTSIYTSDNGNQYNNVDRFIVKKVAEKPKKKTQNYTDTEW